MPLLNAIAMPGLSGISRASTQSSPQTSLRAAGEASPPAAGGKAIVPASHKCCRVVGATRPRGGSASCSEGVAGAIGSSAAAATSKSSNGRSGSPPQSSGAIGGSVWLGGSVRQAEDEVAPMRDADFLRGTTDFMRAAALLDLQLVERMLSEGTKDVDTADVLDQTPLILLSRNRYSSSDVPRAVAVIERLLENGASLLDDKGRLKRDQYGDATLHLAAMACAHNGGAIMGALLKAVPPDALPRCISAKCKNFGNTALHWATLNGEAETCEMLIAHGASLTKRNRQKETVMDYAIKYEHHALRARYAMLAEVPRDADPSPSPQQPQHALSEKGGVAPTHGRTFAEQKNWFRERAAAHRASTQPPLPEGVPESARENGGVEPTHGRTFAEQKNWFRTRAAAHRASAALGLQ